MKVLNYGSLNVDYVYSVHHIVQGGETISSSQLSAYCGGKGLNQSIAMARAGLDVYHAGIVGNDGDMLLAACRENGIHTDYIKQLPDKGGHTIIQVDEKGENCIILYGGTNMMQTEEYIRQVLANFGEGDYLVLQNEVNCMDLLIDVAAERGMKIVLNPSPFNEQLSGCDLGKVSLFLLNEIEGNQITGQTDPDGILQALAEKYPAASFVLTLGGDGSVFSDGKRKYKQGIFKVKAVDTTAAGDTFTGYYLAGVLSGLGEQEALRRAAMASSIAVSRAGAVPSIPQKAEVDEAMGKAI